MATVNYYLIGPDPGSRERWGQVMELNIGYGWSYSKICKELGMNKSHIAYIMKHYKRTMGKQWMIIRLSSSV